MDPVVVRAVLVVTLVVALAVAARWWRRRQDEVRDVTGQAASLEPDHLDAVGLDLDGAEAGAVLLGSPTCTPCDQVRQVLSEVERERGAFRWVYADAADHLELAEDHRVMRVPTLFLVSNEGRILARTSGIPRSEQLHAVLDGRHDDVEVA